MMRVVRGIVIVCVFLMLVLWVALRLINAFRAEVDEELIFVTVQRHDLKSVIRGVGILEARHLIEIKTPIDGKISFLIEKTGEFVEENELLYRIENHDIGTALELAKAEYYKTEREMKIIRKGPDQTVLLEQEAIVAKAKRNYEKKLRELANNKELFEKGFISEDDLANLKNDENTAKLEFDLARRRFDKEKEGKTPEDIQYAEAQLKSKKKQWEKLKEKALGKEGRAPKSAKIIRKFVELHEDVSENQTLLSLLDPLDGYRIRSRVLESDAVKLQMGDPVLIELAGFEDEIHGRVEEVSLAAETVGNTKKYPLVIGFDELPDRRIPHLGGHVEYEIVLKEKRGVLSIPLTIVNRYGNKEGVWSFVDDQRDFLPLSLGINDGVYVEVLDGLSEGQEIAIPRS